MKRSYRLIDADTHVNEPPDLWTSRVPARYRDRAPRIERFEQGDAWILEGVADPINFGLNATAGMAPEQMKGWVRFEDIRPGGWDPAARLEEMDLDRIDAAVLYPTPRLSHAVIANRDAGFHLAQVCAYNDWLAEYCAATPGSLVGIPAISAYDIDQARSRSWSAAPPHSREIIARDLADLPEGTRAKLLREQGLTVKGA